jgi:hypothetical protein
MPQPFQSGLNITGSGVAGLGYTISYRNGL